MDTPIVGATVEQLFERWTREIPLVTAMEITLQKDSSDGWQLEAPLAPNKNHMDTGFGGSLAAIGTLAGWLQTWRLIAVPQHYHIVIARSEIDYLEPATGRLIGKTTPPATEVVDAFQAGLACKNKARIILDCYVESDGNRVLNLRGTFVAFAKTAG